MDTTEIIQEWLYGRASGTQQAYLRDVSQLLETLHSKPLEAISLKDLQRWQAELLELHVKPGSIARKTSAVRGLFRHALRQGHISRNPALDLRSPKTHWRPHELAVDRQTMLAIIEAAAPGRDRALIHLLYAAAARVSEICNLQWRDCRPIASGGAVVSVLGKRDKWRSMTVPPAVWAEVVQLRNGAPDDAKVFDLTRQQVGVIVKAAAIAAGGPEWFSPHKIRHATATHALEAGAPLVAVQALLGHAEPSTTLIYATVSHDRSAIDYLAW